MSSEQSFVTLLYGRLDRMRAETAALRDSYRRDSDNTPGGRVQRDIGYAHHNATLQALTLAEDRLVFGRLDSATGSSMHVGRLGIFAEGTDDAQLLMDWRAPSARPFYVATAADPQGVARRRHLKVRRRRVESLSDEYLDVRPETLAALHVSPAEVSESQGLAGESALLDALNAARTGRMSDIVETIQAEQDRIIRSDRGGVLVVQGGPGTGKTAVALHRVAYLLYTHREQLASRGVLIIGPNRTFLSYIGQVLPSLGENAVVLSTMGDLFPGVSARAVDEPAVAVLKGRTSMAPVIANALLDRQRVPTRTLLVESDQGTLRIDPNMLRRAQSKAWGSKLPHNRARGVFVRTVITALARQIMQRHRSGLAAGLPFTAEDLADTTESLRQDEAVAVALRDCWPLISAQRLVGELLSSERRLAVAGTGLSPRQRELLLRPAGAPWTISDVPLLDEAAELLGPLTSASGEVDSDRRESEEYAEEVLDMLAEEHEDAEAADRGTRGGFITARDLAALQENRVTLTSTAERAAADREWTYGHVVVDEAQELSPMAWRSVMRRCPLRSMTLVGDIAQTGDPAGARSWSSVLRPHVQDRWRLEELTVNYRTPSEIAAIADRLLARIDPTLKAPTSVRSTGVEPWWREVSEDKLARAAAEAVAEELSENTDEHIAVLVPNRLRQPVQAAMDAADKRDATDRRDGTTDELSDRGTADSGDPATRAGAAGDRATENVLLSRVVVLTVAEAKGLEFDVVILVEPDAIEAESSRGLGNVYVALTRATQRLGVLYSGQLPAIAS